MSRFKEYKVVTESVVTHTYWLEARSQDEAEDLFFECVNDLTSDDEWDEEELVDVVETW